MRDIKERSGEKKIEDINTSTFTNYYYDSTPIPLYYCKAKLTWIHKNKFSAEL